MEIREGVRGAGKKGKRKVSLDTDVTIALPYNSSTKPR